MRTWGQNFQCLGWGPRDEKNKRSTSNNAPTIKGCYKELRGGLKKKVSFPVSSRFERGKVRRCGEKVWGE